MRKLAIIPLILFMLAFMYGCAAKPAAPDPKNALFFDDFSQSNGGWTQLKNEEGTIEYTHATYHMFVNKPATLLLAHPGKSFQGDVSIEVDARKLGGPDDNYLGILCRYQNPDNYYFLMVTSDGFAAIAMRKNGQDALISAGQEFLEMNGVKKGNTTNHIRADCIGETLTLYANGKQVALAYDNSLTGGDAGLGVRSGRLAGNVDIRFDNFIVSRPIQP